MYFDLSDFHWSISQYLDDVRLETIIFG